MSEKQHISSNPEPVKKKSDFLKFLYNGNTGEVLGRTGISWAKIGLFYLGFYACLAAFFAIMLTIFVETLPDDQPKWILEDSRIGTNPGMGMYPKQLVDNVDSTLIRFSHNKPKTYKMWTQSIEDYFNVTQKTIGKSGGKSVDCATVVNRDRNAACLLHPEKLIPDGCSKDADYGYRNGKPCIILKLNRIFNWVPEPYNSSQLPAIPASIRENFQSNHIKVSCEGENAADKENIGHLEYSPKAGFRNNFYPFVNQDRFVSPIVFVHFTNPRPGILINVQCRAWAKNIIFNPSERTGGIHFELLVD